MNKHTPGPWELHGLAIYEPDKWRDGRNFGGAYICQIMDGNFEQSSPDSSTFKDGCECDANARLIAAAPELLAALQAVIEQADAQFKAGDKHATFNRQTIDSLRPAITKATQG
jgi:hypothetical protein